MVDYSTGLLDVPGGSAPPVAPPLNPATLRRIAWEIGEQKAADHYVPAANHVGLGMVSPAEGYAHWNIRPEWVEQTAHAKGEAWRDCRLVLRLYDVSFIDFNGFNAHRIQDEPMPALRGQRFFRLIRPGTWQLAEVGFLLRNGEFVPAARSQVVPFPPDAPSRHGSQAALLVDSRRRVEEVGSVWDQERILAERRKPRLRCPLRIAFFAMDDSPEGRPARFVVELATHQRAQGHDVSVFLPATAALAELREEAGVRYEPLPVSRNGGPVAIARAFARAAASRLEELAPFDLVHLHEWMAGLLPSAGECPTVLSLSSLEVTRRNGTPPDSLAWAIQQAERDAARAADCLLTPDWLRDRALAEFGLDGGHVHAFPMEARLPTEWEVPLDYGTVKKEIGCGPLDRLMLFVGPLEHAAGPDLLLDALPVLLQRAGNCRLAFVGAGQLYGCLEHRARELGVTYAVRLLGHVEGPRLTRLLRAAEALVLPSRHRVPFDDAVVDLARRAARPVVTTHGGPAHLVRHEETGLVTYDNPGSMVWALDRILGDPGHAERMGRNGRNGEGAVVGWGEVTRHYLDRCAACFPELRQEGV